MIKKITTIKNLGVFKNFVWDSTVKSKDGHILNLAEINILYGRNYSGKTTLSRILRAIENGSISDKFEAPEFAVSFKDGTEIKQDSLTGHNKKIRVFNEDFVRDNLRFITNPEESIESFAILGIDNNLVEEEINRLKVEVGNNQAGQESGLYLKQKNANNELSIANNAYTNRLGEINNKLNAKATDRTIGIKYKAEKFGDQNYSRPKLDDDIRTVLATTFNPITNEEQTTLEKLIVERVNDPINTTFKLGLNITAFSRDTELLVKQPIGVSNKIDELIKDALLNKWVKEGRQLHKDKRINCAFCNNEIKESRWEQLEKHYDEESEKLEDSIDQLIKKIETEFGQVTNGFNPNKSLFYSKFHSEIEKQIEQYKNFSQLYNNQLQSLILQLKERKEDLINPKVFVEVSDYSKDLEAIFKSYEDVRILSNNYTSTLSQDQSKAKVSLKLKEIFDYLTTINYKDEVKTVNELKAKAAICKTIYDEVSNAININTQKTEVERRKLKDESKGADKVNEYLNNFFGHEFLSLKPIETIVEELKTVRFEVIRGTKKAYHLSEGECSLIAFCYFMAKLDDIETKGAKPIIWIDDPISSLDGNHIFFVYSLINVELASKNIFGQLFISTHNLDFLKYLKRLKGFFLKPDGKTQELSKAYFIVQRNDTESFLLPMPNYLKEFVTEFNYLFHQIFKCSRIAVIDDSNYTTFYNFANNARKFLEIYLYYKFPDSSDENLKLQKFFGGDRIPTIFTERISNEYSHLSAVFERGATPIEVPEMKSAADLIIKKIKEIDAEQYNSLLESIGEVPLV